MTEHATDLIQSLTLILFGYLAINVAVFVYLLRNPS